MIPAKLPPRITENSCDFSLRGPTVGAPEGVKFIFLESEERYT